MDLTLNTIIMLTTEDRRILVESLNELIPFKVKVLSSFEEFEPSLALEYDNLVLIDSVVKDANFYGKLEFFKEVFDLKCFYVSTDRLWQNAMRKYCDIVDVDYRKLDYRLLVAILYSDLATQREYAAEVRKGTMDVAKGVLQNSSTDEDKLLLAREFVAAAELLEEYQEREQSLVGDCAKLMDEVLAARQETQRYTKAYNELFEKIYAVNRFLTQSNTMKVEDVYRKVSVDGYRDRPFIFYFKEYEELIELDAFLATLHDAFKIQKQASVKVLRLMDSHDSKRALTIPGYYNRVSERFEKTEIYKSDFLVRFGEYEKLLDLLLTNTTKLDILIVVDQKFHADTVLEGKFITMNMCRNAQHLPSFGLSEANTIVNNSKDMKYSLSAQPSMAASKDDRFLQLSNTQLVQSILELYLSVMGRGGDPSED